MAKDRAVFSVVAEVEDAKPLAAVVVTNDALVADASGDTLDAVLCLLQAGWAASRPGWGLPAQVDPLEGWILSA